MHKLLFEIGNLRHGQSERETIFLKGEICHGHINDFQKRILYLTIHKHKVAL